MADIAADVLEASAYLAAVVALVVLVSSMTGERRSPRVRHQAERWWLPLTGAGALVGVAAFLVLDPDGSYLSYLGVGAAFGIAGWLAQVASTRGAGDQPNRLGVLAMVLCAMPVLVAALRAV